MSEKSIGIIAGRERHRNRGARVKQVPARNDIYVHMASAGAGLIEIHREDIRTLPVGLECGWPGGALLDPPGGMDYPTRWRRDRPMTAGANDAFCRAGELDGPKARATWIIPETACRGIIASL
jgi:hypothetical protein